jgi:hypothetical protein
MEQGGGGRLRTKGTGLKRATERARLAELQEV